MAVGRVFKVDALLRPWQVEVWQVSSPRALQALVNRTAATRLSDTIFHSPVAKPPLPVLLLFLCHSPFLGALLSISLPIARCWLQRRQREPRRLFVSDKSDPHAYPIFFTCEVHAAGLPVLMLRKDGCSSIEASPLVSMWSIGLMSSLTTHGATVPFVNVQH